MLSDAIKLTLAKENVSTSYLQRQLGCGWNKAAELMEAMEERGVVSKCDHRGRRKIDQEAGRAALTEKEE